MSDPGPNIGDDGYVLLRAYLPNANGMWFSASCRACHRIVAISVHAAVAAMPYQGATVGHLARRLSCSVCNRKDIQVQITPDTRNPEVCKRDGPMPETRTPPLR